MRITKKYAGASCIGKQVFQQCDDYFSNTSTIQENEIELQKLETLFLLRINSSKSASGIPHIIQSPIESHHSKYEIILVNKHEIRSDNASAVNNSIEDYNYNNNNSSKNKFNNSMSLTLSTTNSMMKDDEEDFGYYDDYCDEDNDDTDDDNDMLGALVDSNVNKDVLPSVYDYNNASPNNLYQDYSMKGTASSSSSSSSFMGKGGLSKGGRRNFSAPNLTLLHNNSSSSSYYSNSKMRNINDCTNNSMVGTINNSNIKADSESNYSSNGSSSSSIIRSNSNNKLFSTHHSNRKHLLNSSSSTDQSSFLTRKRAHSVMDFAEFEKIVNDEKAAGILY